MGFVSERELDELALDIPEMFTREAAHSNPRRREVHGVLPKTSAIAL